VTVTVELRPADGELDYVEGLLAAAGLPTEDVGSTPESFYVGVRDDGSRVGCGGIEACDEVGLLRSVVIEPDCRGEGYGAALAAALEERARAEGVETLYLLTTTAAEFFDSQGYDRVDRGAAPAAIRGTTQFAELCPDSAVCMRTEIEGCRPR